MGKIFKALEKAQRSIKTKQDGVNTFETENLSDYPPSDKHNVANQTVANQTVANQTVANQEIKSETITMEIDQMLVAGLKPQSIEAEQFRLLKNNILFPEKGTPPKCIMITSSSPGDGKSFVAANLAISLSQNIDEHVLLLDCDLRSPSIHSLFGLEDKKGLSEYLSKAEPLSSLLVKTPMNKLTLLLAGEIPSNPSELLSSEQMRQLIHELKQRYSDRYIIIDTPPPYLTSETGAISRQVDGIVIVVQQGKTRKQDLLDLIDVYGRDKILGVVYNFVSKKVGYGYGKYGYGKYGYGKYGYGVKNA